MAARRSALLRSVVVFSIAFAVRLGVWSQLAHQPSSALRNSIRWNTFPGPPSHVHAEEWSATGYALIHLRESEQADGAFRNAIAEDACWSPAWAGLGVVAGNRGDLAGAESLLGKALLLQPDNFAAQ